MFHHNQIYSQSNKSIFSSQILIINWSWFQPGHFFLIFIKHYNVKNNKSNKPFWRRLWKDTMIKHNLKITSWIQANHELKCTSLTHYQTTNFRLFKTERVCRRQFQIWQKWQKVISMGRKHCGKRRNCSLRAISPFPSVFSKGLFSRGVKGCHCVGMG